MRKPFLISVMLLASVPASNGAQAPRHAAAPAPAPWLLDYAGKDMNQLVLDHRFPRFARTHITARPVQYWIDKPSRPSQDALEILHGPPGDIHIVENRYVTGDACAPHDCVDRGLLWVDTHTGATVLAASIYGDPVQATPGNHAHLWLFTNTLLQADSLPPSLTSAIQAWSATEYGDGSHAIITTVTLVQPDGKQQTLEPAAVHAWRAAQTVPATHETMEKE